MIRWTPRIQMIIDTEIYPHVGAFGFECGGRGREGVPKTEVAVECRGCAAGSVQCAGGNVQWWRHHTLC
jgi:hypothetical protein